MKGTLFDHVFKFIDIQCKHSGLVRTVQSHICLQAVVKLLPCALERAKVLLCTRGRSSQLRRTGIRRRTKRVAGKKGRDQDLRYPRMSLLIYSVLKWGDHLFGGWECSEAPRKLFTEGRRQNSEQWLSVQQGWGLRCALSFMCTLFWTCQLLSFLSYKMRDKVSTFWRLLYEWKETHIMHIPAYLLIFNKRWPLVLFNSRHWM